MASKQYPGWVFLVAGLFIGLFIAFLFYLQQQPSVDTPTLQDTKESIKKIREDKIKAKQDEASTKTDFDFYKILPELEVVIPDFNKQVEKTNKPTTKETTKTPTAQNPYLLQVGSFSDKSQAENFKAKLALLGLQAFIEPVAINNKNWYRVRLGPYKNKQALLLEQGRLQDNAIKSIVLQPKG